MCDETSEKSYMHPSLAEVCDETNEKRLIHSILVEVCDGINQKNPIPPSCGIGVTYRKKLQEIIP